MSNFLVLFSHNLTKNQIKDINKNYKSNIVLMNEDLKEKWSNVPEDLISLYEYSKDFIEWIDKKSNKGDFVLIQGDFGLTFILVDYCFKKGLIPLYSTTERVHKEITMPDGSVKMEKTFKHKIFRRYEKWEG